MGKVELIYDRNKRMLTRGKHLYKYSVGIVWCVWYRLMCLVQRIFPIICFGHLQVVNNGKQSQKKTITDSIVGRKVTR